MDQNAWFGLTSTRHPGPRGVLTVRATVESPDSSPTRRLWRAALAPRICRLRVKRELQRDTSGALSAALTHQ